MRSGLTDKHQGCREALKQFDWLDPFEPTAVAFSLGANRVLHYLAQANPDTFKAAVAVSPPLDLKMTSRNLRHGWNKIFDRF